MGGTSCKEWKNRILNEALATKHTDWLWWESSTNQIAMGYKSMNTVRRVSARGMLSLKE